VFKGLNIMAEENHSDQSFNHNEPLTLIDNSKSCYCTCRKCFNSKYGGCICKDCDCMAAKLANANG
jgi:hypothetical protein